jgi:hypothetical protein
MDICKAQLAVSRRQIRFQQVRGVASDFVAHDRARLSQADQGALAGGLVGGALPGGGAFVTSVTAPFISNLLAQINPGRVARRQVARAIVESGQTPD